jgi:hypothetical protein
MDVAASSATSAAASDSVAMETGANTSSASASASATVPAPAPASPSPPPAPPQPAFLSAPELVALFAPFTEQSASTAADFSAAAARAAEACAAAALPFGCALPRFQSNTNHWRSSIGSEGNQYQTDIRFPPLKLIVKQNSCREPLSHARPIIELCHCVRLFFQLANRLTRFFFRRLLPQRRARRSDGRARTRTPHRRARSRAVAVSARRRGRHWQRESRSGQETDCCCCGCC